VSRIAGWTAGPLPRAAARQPADPATGKSHRAAPGAVGADQTTRVSAKTGKIMLQQLTIKTSNKATLIPVLRSAMEGEKRMIALGLQKTRLRLVDFEQQFSMSSAEFERRLNSSELEETVTLTDWRMEMGMLHLLEKQYEALQEARID
jgi:hypothetical protein